MNTNRKIIYTDSAKERFEKFQFQVTKEVENYFQERKFVPGDEFIEITASDIDEVAQRFRISRPIRTNPVKTLIPVVYTIMGVVLTLVGLFYDQFKVIISGDPKRLVFVISGVIMIFFSWTYVYILKSRERREQFERQLRELEVRRKDIKV